MRASNQDRERVAAVLQKAMADGQITVAELEGRLDAVYSAKTLGELEPSVADLPGHGLSLVKPSPLVPGATVPTVVPASAGTQSTANLGGILSSVVRKGPWVAPTRINCVALMGSVQLDFRTAQLSGMETVINATAIMGTVDITVPAGMTVKVEGFGVMGTFADNALQTYGADSPVVVVRGLALMGTVEVKTPKKALGS
jgi:hypothetical protein